MTSSSSFYVDSLLLGKHHHHRHQQHHHQQQQQQPARRSDDIMLQLPLLHPSLHPLSQPAFSIYPYIASSGPSNAEVRRGMGSSISRLPCLRTAVGLPTCVCPFCLPLTTTTTVKSSTGSPTRDRQQTGTGGQDRSSPTSRRCGWQPWLQQTRAVADETQPAQSTSIKTELTERLQSHHVTVTGASVSLTSRPIKKARNHG